MSTQGYLLYLLLCRSWYGYAAARSSQPFVSDRQWGQHGKWKKRACYNACQNPANGSGWEKPQRAHAAAKRLWLQLWEYGSGRGCFVCSNRENRECEYRTGRNELCRTGCPWKKAVCDTAEQRQTKGGCGYEKQEHSGMYGTLSHRQCLPL